MMKLKQMTRVIAVIMIALLSIASIGTLSAQEAVTVIRLNDTTIAVEGNGATVEGNVVTIASAGTYSLNGKLTDGQVVVRTEDEGTVTLILNGVDMHSSTSAPIYIKKAKNVALIIADGTQNLISDAATYIYAKEGDNEPNAAIFSDDALTISGTGTLTVIGNFNDGITSKDNLTVQDATIIVQAVDDGIRGKDSLNIASGNYTITVQGDGLKSDNVEDSALGFIDIKGGVFKIDAGKDALQAATNITISGGEFAISAGGGSQHKPVSGESAKGVKAGVGIVINGGSFTIDSADDALNADDSLVINGGTFVISTGDDGMHANTALEIKGGVIEIKKSYEGIESIAITISGGEIHVVSSDDGLNAAGGSANKLFVHSGYVVVDSGGDGVDANGAIEMTGGVVIIHGPTMAMNSAVDYDRGFKITGGFLIAAGSSRMAQTPDATSSQNALLINLTAVQQAGTLVSIQSSDGKTILTFAPSKTFQSIAFSSPDLASGVTYNVFLGGSSDGAPKDGLYQSGTYTPGTQYTTFAVSGVVTQIGQVGRFGRGRP